MKLMLSLVLLGLAASSGRPAQVSFSNTNLVVIGDETNLPPMKGVPYPSTLQVTGLTGFVTTHATVTLRGFAHAFPSDVYLLLVGPGGQGAILMAECGGQNKYPVANLTITLDDAAAAYLPITDTLVSGTFKPTAKELPLSFDFPAPAPPGSSKLPCSLASFANIDPAGTWSLYAVDNGAGDSGALSNGWTLTLTVAVPLQVARAPTNVILSWPATVPACYLQSGTNAYVGSWSNVTNVPTAAGGRLYVTNSLSAVRRFYRLVQ